MLGVCLHGTLEWFSLQWLHSEPNYSVVCLQDAQCHASTEAMKLNKLPLIHYVTEDYVRSYSHSSKQVRECIGGEGTDSFSYTLTLVYCWELV